MDGRFIALEERVDASRRELAEMVTHHVSSLQGGQRETRGRITSNFDSLSEVHATLRQDVADLSRAVHDLRALVSDVLDRLPDPVAPAPLIPAGIEDAAHAEEPSLVDAYEEAAVDRAGSSHEGTAQRPDPETAPEAGLEAVTRRRMAAERSATGPQPPEGASTAPAEGAPDAEEPVRDTDRERGAHDHVLASAATVGAVDLVCHRELWDFIQEHAAHTSHFRAPVSPSEEGRNRLRVTLSGRSLIGVLIAMRDVWLRVAPYGRDDGAWNLSRAVYERVAHDLATTSRTGADPLTVVFDDGVTPPEPATA